MSAAHEPTRIVTFGEVLLRLATPGFSRLSQANSFLVTYAGAEANVAASTANFGLNSLHVTRLPDNDFGKAATQRLASLGVDMSHTVFGSERMAVYFLENGSMQRPSRIVYDRFDSSFANIRAGDFDWEKILAGATWFHYTGITPAISQAAADACLEAAKVARKSRITISGDINYRRNLWQYGKSAQDVMPELVSLSDIIIGGEVDLENCVGITGENFEAVCAATLKRFPNIKKIATTRRESISASHNKLCALLFNGKKLLSSRQYDLTHIVDRIGTGDAFMAGLIYALVGNMDDQDALEFATAACAWKHSIEGDVNVATVGEISTLVKGENTGKLLR